MIRKIFNASKHNREEWLEARHQGLGGSDAPTIVGLSKYGSLYSLYWDKKGALPEKEDTEAMRVGRDLEQYVADRWMEATGKKCQRDPWMYRNDAYPWALADIDRKVVGENAGLECKTTSAYSAKDLAEGIVPPYYYCQCMHYMAVRGFDRMYLGVLVLGRGGGFFHFVIERDQSEIAALMTAERQFWEAHVEADVPPDPDGSEATESAIRAVYGTETPSTSLLMYEHDELLDELAAAKAASKEAQKREKDLQNQVLALMGTNARTEGTGYKLSWVSQRRTTLDTKALREALPEIYERFCRTGESRVFRMTTKK